LNHLRQRTVKFIWLCLVPAVFAAEPVPRLSSINFYGLHRVSESRIQKVLGVREGDPMPPSKGALEDRLEKIPGVVLARLQAVCCEGQRGILFVGIEERGAAHFALHSTPLGDAKLPQPMLDAYDELVRAIEIAARRGSTGEGLTQGHSLMADPDAREIQERFISFASAELPRLREVLRNSADEHQREVAATIIGYASDKRVIVYDLEYAMQDADETVRSSAMRALNAVAILAVKQPNLGLHISSTWFVEMLNSIVLSDRTGATMALLNLTDSRPQDILDLIRGRALPSLVEMAQWKSLSYALPAFVLLGRVGGLSDDAIHSQWTAGDRGAMILKAIGAEKKKRH